ncbi:MAG: Uncharacterized protein H6Q14_270 [Bacteroidetes bacterium]|nr:Uncharacterized protein [Bacteroidota bacterium]
MKLFIAMFALLIWVSASASSPIALEDVRLGYAKAVSDKKLCRHFIDELAADVQSDTHLAYLGAFQAIWANHVFSPVSKLKTFKKGINNIEMAVEKSPDNAEIRFVRLSIQKNSPGFLGYNAHIAEDRQFLLDHVAPIPSGSLRKMINSLLITLL